PRGTIRAADKTLPALRFLTEDEAHVLLAVAARIVPRGEPWPTAEEAGVLEKVDRELSFMREDVQDDFRSGLGVLERWLPIATFRFRAFTAMTPEDQDDYLRGLETSSLSLLRQLYFGMRTLIAFYYFGDARAWPPLGYDGPWVGRVEVAPVEIDFGGGVKG
ncbi:MAG: gluconate 2-dehydrogenase subunit 3 family protein, partial [Candidatus Methylomirabilis sp.]|nr:gluconate 2-dehydrogenase subunit 3 family protein [Deltaproteobacteria bacterium]